MTDDAACEASDADITGGILRLLNEGWRLKLDEAGPFGGVSVGGGDALLRYITALVAERDAAVARAEAAEREGYRRGLEEAAKVAEDAELGWHDGISGDFHPYGPDKVRTRIAAAIRARAQEEEG